MIIKAGYNISFQCPNWTPMLLQLNVHPSRDKYSTYECGIEPVGDSWHPFAVRYYIFALLFLVFDVEAIFLFPWALRFRSLGSTGFVEVVVFVAVLAVGLVYAWRKGALEWV